MLKRALFLVTNENEIGALATFAKTLVQKYDVETHALYVEDVLKYDKWSWIECRVELFVSRIYRHRK